MRMKERWKKKSMKTGRMQRGRMKTKKKLKTEQRKENTNAFNRRFKRETENQTILERNI